jgi:hypothetical protein
MSDYRVLVARLFLGSLLVALGLQTAAGQMSAMRPSTARSDSSLPYGSGSGGRLGGSSLPGDASGLPAYAPSATRQEVSDPYGLGDPGGSPAPGISGRPGPGGPGGAVPRWYSDPNYVTQQGWSTYPAFGSGCWTWQLLPDGLMYKSYLAGGRESRFGTQWVWERNHGWFWDTTLGARVGVVRYGTEDNTWPEGWQLDAEGAAFPRMDLEHDRDLTSADFRVGVPLTMHRGPWETKIGYYHLSSHAGDEFLLAHRDFPRINYVRDAVVLGVGMRFHPDWRLYSEIGYAFYIDGGAKPWEFQFGAEYSPLEQTGLRGAPFLAVNGHLRQEVDFGGSFTAQAGWQWRGQSGHLTRLGAHYFNGMSDQFEFFQQHEEQIGIGLWYDY